MSSGEILRRLSRPFPLGELKWRPGMVSKDQTKAMALFYVSAEAVTARLNEVMGLGWSITFEPLAGEMVIARLALKVEGEWVTREDVGAPAKQCDPSDRLKSAFSQAIKRAATHFGVGAYIALLPVVWLDYDSQRKRFTSEPRLPEWALPRAGLPLTGEALFVALAEGELKLAGRTPPVCDVGDLTGHIRHLGLTEKWPEDFREWSPEQIEKAWVAAGVWKKTHLDRAVKR